MRVDLYRRDDYQRSDLLWEMGLFHTLQNLSPKCEQTQSPFTQDGCKTTVQLSSKLITGENYGDWVKSFPKNVKVDQHLGRFRRMSRWTLHLSAFCEESQGLHTSVKLLSTAHWWRLPLWEKWNPLRYYVSNILSTSVKITPTKCNLVSTRHWLVHSATELDFSINWASTEPTGQIYTLQHFHREKRTLNRVENKNEHFKLHKSKCLKPGF